MKASSNSRKKAEAQQLQIEVYDDEGWKAIISRQGLLVIDVYAHWCGPCSSMIGHLRRIKMELGDDCLTLATASADKITALAPFRGKSEPTFLLFGGGKPISAIHGADGPNLLITIRDLLTHERNLARGKTEKQQTTVLLESLVKPEEVIESDEDLDDIEGDKPDNEESDEDVPKITDAVLLISPNIIATDKIEEFLSSVVSAGLMISGHVQQEISKEELSAIFRSSSKPSKEVEDGKSEEGNQETSANEKEENKVAKDVDPLIEVWEEELSKGPLYMLLLRTDEGDIFQSWTNLLGPTDLKTAKETDPECLVSQFGVENLVVPAWLPKSQAIQEKLKTTFFPPPPHFRLLLLPDVDDHHQVLEALCGGGLQVLAHTQAVMTEEAATALNISNSTENMEDQIGCAMLAAVITGENAPLVSSELRSLHLTVNSEKAFEEIAVFFPDLAVDLMNDPPNEEPQTQMQIEQKKENSK